jgi:hypothetical protein
VDLPDDRGGMTVADVLAASAGPERDEAIDAWCECVWNAFHSSRPRIPDVLQGCRLRSVGYTPSLFLP